MPLHSWSHPAAFHRPDIIKDHLDVVVTVSNPERYRSRWKLLLEFLKHATDDRARVTLVEVAFGERAYVLDQGELEGHLPELKGRLQVVPLRTKSEIWLKENALNIGIQHIPTDWKYVAWIDPDITFGRHDWVGECLQQLQHFHVLQMFSEAQDLSYKHETLKTYKSFMYCYSQNRTAIPVGINGHPIKMPPGVQEGDYALPSKEGVSYWHPGFAWAARRQAINDLGGLIDWGILGGGDTFMAYALIGMLNSRTMPRSLGATGVRWLQEWQARAERYVRRNVGHMDGTILHHWHGNRNVRGYKDRGQILVGAHFNPDLDIKRDWQGLYQLTDRCGQLRDDARDYFRRRDEDATY
jgi:hypothetical protein